MAEFFGILVGGVVDVFAYCSITNSWRFYAPPFTVMMIALLGFITFGSPLFWLLLLASLFVGICWQRSKD